MEFETNGRTDAANCPSVGLSRVAAMSTRRDGSDRGGRCCRACSSVRPFQTPSKRRTDGRTDCPSIRPSLRWSLTQWWL